MHVPGRFDLSPDRRTGHDLFYEPVISATPESFRAQIKWLRSHLHLVTLEELIEQVQTGSPWREPTVLLTFDDAYRDNFEVAVPILRESKYQRRSSYPRGFSKRQGFPGGTPSPT